MDAQNDENGRCGACLMRVGVVWSEEMRDILIGYVKVFADFRVFLRLFDGAAPGVLLCMLGLRLQIGQPGWMGFVGVMLMVHC